MIQNVWLVFLVGGLFLKFRELNVNSISSMWDMWRSCGWYVGYVVMYIVFSDYFYGFCFSFFLLISLIFFMVFFRKITLSRKPPAKRSGRKFLVIEEISKICLRSLAWIVGVRIKRMSGSINRSYYGFASKNSALFIRIRTPVWFLRHENRIVRVSLPSNSSSNHVFLHGVKW